MGSLFGGGSKTKAAPPPVVTRLPTPDSAGNKSAGRQAQGAYGSGGRRQGAAAQRLSSIWDSMSSGRIGR